jgi:hypothetical protein
VRGAARALFFFSAPWRGRTCPNPDQTPLITRTCAAHLTESRVFRQRSRRQTAEVLVEVDDLAGNDPVTCNAVVDRVNLPAVRRNILNQQSQFLNHQVARIMEVFRIQPDGSPELVASGLNPQEVGGLRDWFSYTTPVGPGIQIVVRSERDLVLGLVTSGTQPGRRATRTVAGPPHVVREVPSTRKSRYAW